MRCDIINILTSYFYSTHNLLNSMNTMSQERLKKLKNLMFKFVDVANDINTFCDLNIVINGPEENVATSILVNGTGKENVDPKVTSGNESWRIPHAITDFHTKSGENNSRNHFDGSIGVNNMATSWNNSFALPDPYYLDVNSTHVRGTDISFGINNDAKNCTKTPTTMSTFKVHSDENSGRCSNTHVHLTPHFDRNFGKNNMATSWNNNFSVPNPYYLEVNSTHVRGTDISFGIKNDAKNCTKTPTTMSTFKVHSDENSGRCSNTHVHLTPHFDRNFGMNNMATSWNNNFSVPDPYNLEVNSTHVRGTDVSFAIKNDAKNCTKTPTTMSTFKIHSDENSGRCSNTHVHLTPHFDRNFGMNNMATSWNNNFSVPDPYYLEVNSTHVRGTDISFGIKNDAKNCSNTPTPMSTICSNVLHDTTRSLPDDTNVRNGDSIYDLDSRSIVYTNVGASVFHDGTMPQCSPHDNNTIDMDVRNDLDYSVNLGGDVGDASDNNRKIQHAEFGVVIDEFGGFEPTNNISVTGIETKRRQGCNNTYMTVPLSGRKSKILCCAYCLKRCVKLARHLENKHKNEPDVKRFRALPPRSKQRLQIIAKIRKLGQYKWNTDAELNGGELQPSRRQNIKFKKMAVDYRSCANCLGTFARTFLRCHWNKCTNNSMKHERVVHELSRAVEGRIHPEASDDLREMFKMIRDDESIRMIRFDWLVINFANDMCLNYSPIYQHGYTCSKIRDAARILCAAKSISTNITDLESFFKLEHCNTAIETIRKITRFDMKTKEFDIPNTALTLITLIIALADLLIIENLKEKEFDKAKEVETFLRIFRRESRTKISKLVAVQKAKYKLTKTIIIPSTADVQKLTNYLDSERHTCYFELKHKFSYQKWLQLAELTMLSILLFNRKRTGEMRNIRVSHFINREIITGQCDTQLENLDEETMLAIKSRMRIRGKLRRPVPLLLKHSYDECLDLLLKHRKEARIPDSNDFLFAVPSTTGKLKRIDLCAVLRSMSTKCGASNPISLRGTHFRKHFVTFCGTQKLSDDQVTRVSRFMGHDTQTHRDYYRQDPMGEEVGEMYPLLEAAQGNKSVLSSAPSKKTKKSNTKKSGMRVVTLKRQQNKTMLVNKKNNASSKRTNTKISGKRVVILKQQQNKTKVVNKNKKVVVKRTSVIKK